MIHRSFCVGMSVYVLPKKSNEKCSNVKLNPSYDFHTNLICEGLFWQPTNGPPLPASIRHATRC